MQLDTAQQKLQTQLQGNETSITRLKGQIEAESRGKEDSVRPAAVYKDCVSQKLILAPASKPGKALWPSRA